MTYVKQVYKYAEGYIVQWILLMEKDTTIKRCIYVFDRIVWYGLNWLLLRSKGIV